MRILMFVLTVMTLFGVLPGDLSAQMVDNFNQYSWEQKDSIIETLYRGRATAVVNVMIKQAYEEEVARTEKNPAAMAAFSMWEGVRYLSEGALDQATQLLQTSVELYRQQPEMKRKRYSDALINLSDVYLEQNDFPRALEYLDEVIQLIQADTLMDAGNRLNTLLHGIDVSLQAYAIEKAESYGKQALQVAQEHYGNQSDEYFQSLAKVGQIYLTQGELRRASNLILQSYELAKQYLPLNHANRIYYGNLAVGVCRELGRVQQAETIYSELMDFYESNSDFQDDLSYPAILDQMGSFYQEQGDLEKAYEYYNRANILFELRLENIDPRYIQSQTNVGNILRLQQKYIEAELYYLAALQYTGQAFGEDSWTEGYLRDNLASMYWEMEEYQKSLDQRLIANEIIEVNLGPNDPEFAVSSLNIGQTYQQLGYDSLARDYMTTAYVKLEQLYGTLHNRVFTAAYSLADYYADQDINLALDYYATAADYVCFYIDQVAPLLSLSERISSRSRYENFIGRYLSFAFTHRERYPNAINQAQKLVHAAKRMDSYPDMVSAVALMEAASADIRRDFIKWQDLRSRFLLAQDQTIAERREAAQDLEALHEALVQLEKTVFPGYARVLHEMQITEQSQLKAKLLPGQALVDFLRIKWYDSDNESFATGHHYLAFITSGASPVTNVIHLQLNQNVLETRQTRSPAAYADQIWKPLMPHLASFDKLYISPDGEITKVSFAALAMESGDLVWDNYEVVYLAHTQNLVRTHQPSTLPERVVFLGNPALDQLPQDDGEAGLPLMRIPARFMADQNTRGSMTWVPVTGAGQEVTQLANQLQKKRDVQIYKDESATKSNLVDLWLHSNTALHLNIPAFMLSNSIETDDTLSEEIRLTSSWLKSGFGLAGATQSWKSDTVVSGAKDDGLLTALELSTLDLSDQQFLVLTGLEFSARDQDNGPSFQQILRALSWSGVDEMLVSLWPVNLNERLVFFNRFYKEMSKGRTAAEALQRAQKKMRKKYDPQHWAGFVLVR